MPVVYQSKPLSMGWCLDCHRAPEQNLRPPALVTDMDYKAEDQVAVGLELQEELDITSKTSCSTCHR